MATPNDVIKWLVDNWWVVPFGLWVMVALGVTGSIYSFIKWVNNGFKQLFNPKYLIILTIVLIVFGIVTSMLTDFISGGFKM